MVSELPEDHLACAAYLSSAREVADSLSMTHLFTDRMDPVQRLVAANTAHADRIWAGYGGGLHPHAILRRWLALRREPIGQCNTYDMPHSIHIQQLSYVPR